MFDRRMFAEMRRAGMGVGVSKAKLSQAMLDVLVQLPPGTANLKEATVRHLGLIGQMSATRDIDEAWKQAKKRAAKDYPDTFILDDRMALHWNDGTVIPVDRKISTANFKKLNELAQAENCTVNNLISRLIKCYEKTKA